MNAPATRAETAERPESPAEVINRVEKVRLSTLEPEILKRMVGHLESDRENLIDQALNLEARLMEQLRAGKHSDADQTKLDLRRVGRENEELEDELARVGDAYQESFLMRRLIKRLGSRNRVWALEGLVMVLIVAVLAALVWEFTTPGLSLELRRKLFLFDTACCCVFLFEFFLRLSCAESKKWFWKRYWIDFVTSIPLPDAQVLRFGRAARVARLARLARVARFVRLLRLLRIVMFFWRGMDKLHRVMDVKLFRRSMLLGLGILLGGAGIIFALEGQQDPGVGTFGQSVWWSFTTVVTGGFGDIYNPTSSIGRLVTVFLIIAGMTVVGIFTATLTSVLVGDESENLALMQRSLETRLEELGQRLERLEHHLVPPAEAAPPEAEESTANVTETDSLEPTPESESEAE